MAAQVELDESNISSYGGSEHRDLRQAAAEQGAFKGCGKQVGIEVWRIEKLTVVPWPKKMYGQLYSGDCYIVLHTYTAPGSKKLLYNAHFWIGESATQDEYGCCAISVVELDDLLGDLPVQYREVQGNESKQFLALWKKSGGLKILDGGVDSGFNQVKAAEYRPRLLHVKGRDSIRVQQVPLRTESLNDGDVFVLDHGLKLFAWNGSTSSHFERRQAMAVIAGIKDDRNGKPSHRVLDALEEDEEFWGYFGGRPARVKPATSDDDVEAGVRKLFKLSDESGKMKFTLVAENEEFERKLLDPNDVMIVDDSYTVFAWVGAGASTAERKKAMSYAALYLNQEDRPITTPIVRVVQGGEPSAFDAVFFGAASDKEVKRARPIAAGFGGLRAGSKGSGAAAGAAGGGGGGGGAGELKQDGTQHAGVVTVIVHEAKDLKDVQKIGKADPFAEVRLGKTKHRSATHEDGNHEANWNDWMCRLGLGGKKCTELLVTIKNDNIMVDKKIGSFSIPAGDLLSKKGESEWIALTDKNGRAAGQVRVSISYRPPSVFRVIEARGLHDTQRLGKQDPYATVEFAGSKHRTPTHENGNKEAKWAEEAATFRFNFPLYEKTGETLILRVKNDNVVSDALIGECSLNLQTLQAASGKETWHTITRGSTNEKAGEVLLGIVY